MRGARGRDIEWLQKKLNTIVPTYLLKLIEDGIWGAKTDARVREFQKISGLKVDGIVGPNTMKKMLSAPSAFGPSLPPNFDVNNPPFSKASQHKKALSKNGLIANMTEVERRKIFEEAAETLPYYVQADFIKFLGVFGKTAKVAQLAEIATLASKSVGTVASMAGGVIVAIQSILAFVQAWQTNEKMYAIQGWAYTITAWVYNEPRPKSSPEMLRRFSQISSTEVIKMRKDAWEKTSIKTWHNLNALPGRLNVDKKTVQKTFEFWGYYQYLRGNHARSYTTSDPKQRLCAELQRTREKDFRTGINRSSWKHGFESVLYPR